MTIADFLQRHKTESTQLFLEVYEACRPYCIGWLMDRYVKRDIKRATDIYLEAVLILCENAKKGKIKSSDTLVSTYLTSICRNLASSENRRPAGEELFEDLIREYDTLLPEAAIEKEAFLSRLDACVEKLGDKCQNILKKYYWEHKSFDEIGKEIEMAASVAKATKWKCMNKLKNLFFNTDS